MASSIATSQLTSLPGFLATASTMYPSFLSTSGGATPGSGGFNFAASLSNLTAAGMPSVRSGSPPSSHNGFAVPLIDDDDKKSNSIVSLRLKAKEHMDSMGKTIIGQ